MRRTSHRAWSVWAGSLAAIVLASAAPVGCATPPGGPADTPPDRQLAEDGRAIAERQCASCHAIGATGDSPRAGAAPLRDILALYDEDMLTTDLIEGIRVGHEEMPIFDFNVTSADALIAYLRSIENRP